MQGSKIGTRYFVLIWNNILKKKDFGALLPPYLHINPKHVDFYILYRQVVTHYR